jgi:hypothetical protein
MRMRHSFWPYLIPMFIVSIVGYIFYQTWSKRNFKKMFGDYELEYERQMGQLNKW